MKKLILLLCCFPGWMQPAFSQKKDSVRMEYSEEEFPFQDSKKNSYARAWSDDFPGNFNFSWHNNPYCLEWFDNEIHIDIPEIDIDIPDIDFNFDWRCPKEFHHLKKEIHKKRKRIKRKIQRDSTGMKMKKHYKYSTQEDEKKDE